MNDFRVFIHSNDQQQLGAILASYSYQKQTKGKIKVEILNLKNFQRLTSKQGRPYRRKGTLVNWWNEDLQSFSPLRFLPPQLMHYTGRALITDPDVFAVGNILELLTLEMGGKSILCRSIEEGKYTGFHKQFFATSVMLLDCAQLRHWNWDEHIENLFEQKFDYGDWINLKLENPDTIGTLEEKWNSFDKLEPDTRLLHTTERITQPWKTGLPRDFNLGREFTLRWGHRSFSPKRTLRQMECFIRGPNFESGRFYKPHPDPQQELAVLQLARECLDRGILTESFIKENIHRRFVRPDFLKLLTALKIPSGAPMTSEVPNEIRI